MIVKNLAGISSDSNAYLIGARRKTLVDAGMDPRRLLPDADGLSLIVLTHCHYDHVGAVPGIVEATGAKVAMHAEDAGMLAREPSAALFGARRPRFTVDILLRDGEAIDLGDAVLRVIHTPGHTPGSVCLYDEESRALFTGDTVFEGGSFGRTDIGGNARDMVASLEKLAALDVSALYPGHGGAVTRRAKESLLASYRNAKYMLS